MLGLAASSLCGADLLALIPGQAAEAETDEDRLYTVEDVFPEGIKPGEVLSGARFREGLTPGAACDHDRRQAQPHLRDGKWQAAHRQRDGEAVGQSPQLWIQSILVRLSGTGITSGRRILCGWCNSWMSGARMAEIGEVVYPGDALRKTLVHPDMAAEELPGSVGPAWQSSHILTTECNKIGIITQSNI